MQVVGTILALVISISGLAQSPQVIYSQPIEEPDGLNAKTFQCSNGNTLLLNFTPKKGIEIDVFDTARQKSRHAVITGALWDPTEMSATSIEGIYNIGDQVALFLSQQVDGKPSLFRILISPITGLSAGQSKIADIPKYKMLDKFYVDAETKTPKGFFVETDPTSGAYAVLVSNSFDESPGKALRLLHFDASHKEIASAYFDDKQAAASDYLGMIVRGTAEHIRAQRQRKRGEWYQDHAGPVVIRQCFQLPILRVESGPA